VVKYKKHTARTIQNFNNEKVKCRYDDADDVDNEVNVVLW